ncbi:MAG: hypothetical protein ACLGGV_05375 [Bacteroidia bacterium]
MTKKVILPLILLVALAAYLLYITKFQDNNDQPFSDFALEDTTSLVKIKLSRTTGEEIQLEKKDDNVWYISETEFRANEEALALIMKTFSQWKVLQDVEGKKMENILKLLSSKHTKIELFKENERKPFRTYYVGDHNPSMTGNYALLQKEDKKSSVPYLVNIPGFYGTIETRFFVSQAAWRSQKVIELDPLDIKSVMLKDFKMPEESYTLNVDKDKFQLLDQNNKEVQRFDTLSARRHLVSFKKLYLESFVGHMSPEETKTLIQSTPLYELFVTDKNDNTTHLKIYCKKPDKEILAPDGSVLPCDTDRSYVLINGKDLVIVQSFGWGNVFKPLSYFTTF